MIGERFLFIFFSFFLFYFLFFFPFSFSFFWLLLLSLLRCEENRRERLSRYICLFLFFSLLFFSSLFLFLFFFFLFSALINQTLIQKPMSQQPPRLVCRSPSRLWRCAKFRRLCSCSCWIQVGSFQSVSTYLSILSPHFFFFFPLVLRMKKKTVTYDPPSKKHNIAVTVNGKLVSSLPPTSPDNLGKSPSPSLSSHPNPTN